MMTTQVRGDHALEKPTVTAEFVRDMVRRQMNRSGNILLSSVEPLDDEDFYKPFVNGSSIAWTIGHLACVFDLFTTWLGAPDKALPREMHDVFNSLDLGSEDPNPPTKAETVDRKRWTRKLLIARLRESQVRALKLLEDFDPVRWYERSPPGAPDTLPTVGDIWESLAVHTFWHLGELSGAHPRFKGTYTLNTVLHYFHVDDKDREKSDAAAGDAAADRAQKGAHNGQAAP